MSLYKDYLEETGYIRIIETEVGFITYRITGNECYVIDLYVKPASRESGIAAGFVAWVTQEAKELGCKYLTGSVNLGMKNPTSNMKFHLSQGMQLVKAEPHALHFGKEIE